MKKNLLFLLGLLVLFISVGCSSDDDDTSDASIVGTWTLQSTTVKGTLTGNGTSIPVNETEEADACLKKTAFTFNSDGSGTSVAYSNDTGVCQNTLSESFNYDFNSSSKILTLTVSGSTETITMSSFSSSKFSIGQSLNNVNFGDYNPVLEGYYFTGTVSTVFVKK